ncbi:hypothetical protein PRIPAC_87477 [Pristionchus pacificus]|uniref:Ion channel n=1 Tax=Pristionchus pacificus TaxID=54126 RepID=A0A2A6CVC7_PRIPA|nr:hypothetical protein PRIPAC_87477 [Pristionchus pacificus]|eukprot:PDM82036.1 ion channel [Pristionchus pacificus]
MNGGTCTGDRYDYTCECPQGYSGMQCQVSGNACDGLSCENGGNCTLVLDNSRGVCDCPHAWQGPTCEQNNLLSTRNCENCDGTCYKRPSQLNDTRLFTPHENDPMTSAKCKTIMMGIPTAEFYILAGSICYTGTEPMVTEESNDAACDTACPGSTSKNPSKCGDDDNVLLVMYPFDEEATQCTSSSCGFADRGYCVEQLKGFSCVCAPGTTGKTCQTTVNPCTNFDCQNGGVCMTTENNSAARCLCKDGYWGTNCEHEDTCRSQSVTCKNGGTCVNSNTTSGYNCTCYPNYGGDECENFLACSSNPCGYGSECLSTGNNEYKCACTAGWQGDDCDEDINECEVAANKRPEEFLCVNGGTCNNTIGSYNCLCLEGTSGFDCSINPDDCNMSYVGPDNNTYPNLCNYIDKEAVCLDGINTYTCKCSPGSKGQYCMDDVNECTESPEPVCENFGTCINSIGSFSCQCLYGTYGFNCSINPDECEISNVTVDGIVYGNECIARDKNATCIDGFGTYNCSCTPQWTGEHCLTDVDECAFDPPPCINFGSCFNTPGDYECKCINGTYGKNCEINPDDCENVTMCNTMDDRANCTDGYASFSCTCGPDYTLQFCDLEVIIYKVLQLIGGGSTNEVELISMLRDLLRNPSMMKDLVPFVIGLQSKENRTRLSWNVEDMFMWIAYEEKKLDLNKDLVAWNDVVLGNCFTFNHFNNTERSYLMRSDGSMGGLKAALKLNSEEYVPWVDVTAIMTFIHPNKETIFSESPRYNAAPSAMTTIQSIESRYQRLGGRYGRCIKSTNEVASYYYDGAYTTDGCLRSCYQDEVKKACECMDSRYPLPEDENVCELADRKCVDSIIARGDVSTWANCACPLPCANSQFDSSFTVVPFVRNRNKCNTYTAAQRFNRTECDDLNGQADYVIVNVQVPRMSITIYQETPSWTLNRIIGNVGGLGGVVCGLNLITFFEFAWFFLFQMPMQLIFNKWNW